MAPVQAATVAASMFKGVLGAAEYDLQYGAAIGTAEGPHTVGAADDERQERGA